MMLHNRVAPILAAVTLLVLLAACTGAPQPTPSPSVSPTPTPTGVTPSPSPTITPAPTPQPTPTPAGVEVTSPAQAAALVLASDARFASVIPLHPELIVQCCWYEAVDAPGGYEVTIVIGWGDCPSGCIEEHRWRFHVNTEGTITPLAEEGSEPVPTPEPGQGPADVTVMLVAGPTCPVVTVPPDPSCAPRPVANAEVVIRDPQGNELHRGLSNEEGVLLMQVPPGAYLVEPQPVAGLMGTPVAAAFSVGAGGAAFLQFEYDTGIR